MASPALVPPSLAPTAESPRLISAALNEITGPLSARANASGVWTGSEVIIWGGAEDELSSSARSFRDGAAYDPERDVWRPIADSPLAARSRHTAVWTGSEMVVWGGSHAGRGFLADGHGRGFHDGAAYDPNSDSWRTIADSPYGWTENAASVWTGTDLIIAMTDRDRGRGATLRILAYRVGSDSWQELPGMDAALASETWLGWTGNELVMRNLGKAGLFRMTADADGWTRVSALPGDLPTLGNLSWTGSHLLTLALEFLGSDNDPEYGHTLAEWNPDSDSWTLLPDPEGKLGTDPLRTVEKRVVFLDSGLAYDIESAQWWSLDVPSTQERAYDVETAVGNSYLMWGGMEGDHLPPVATGVIVSPAWPAE